MFGFEEIFIDACNAGRGDASSDVRALPDEEVEIVAILDGYIDGTVKDSGRPKSTQRKCGTDYI